MMGIRNWFSQLGYNLWTPKRNRNNRGRSTIKPRRFPSPPNTASSDVLEILSCDICTEENGRTHHTDKYYSMSNKLDLSDRKLIIRRGQLFKIILKLNRPFAQELDIVNFVYTLSHDKSPSLGHGTLIGTTLKFNSHELGEPVEWTSVVSSSSHLDNTITILIKPAVNAQIGEWKIDIDTQSVTGQGIHNFNIPTIVVVLFNPWCRDDQVYMADENSLDEYILSDTTLIWRGSYNRLKPSVWKLGQFEKDILECSLLLISNIGKIGPAFLGDPIKISRALSAAVNSPDDDGAVMGNWSEDFAGGIAPTKWIGSVAILQKYFKNQKPVKFGQCWVFSGVLTTIARAIGLPSRIITNYSSAHDTQASLTVDYFVSREGRTMEEMNSDSIWNYHVWNEVWMSRPDLDTANENYGGWQVVDATPQETSDDIYRCGPSSVRAVKLGEILRPYDCNFVYAEVNADKVFWRYDGEFQPLKLLKRDTVGIGQLISTKSVGKWQREDITNSYKFMEKTKDERDTMVKALRQANSAFSRYYLNEDFNDIYFNFELIDDIKIGETFHVVLHIKNRSDEQSYNVSGSLHVETILYTGKHREEVKRLKFDRLIPKNSMEIIKLEVEFHEYFEKLMDQGAFNISCMATVQDTDYEYFAQDDFRVRKPDIKIMFQGEPVAGKEIDVIVRLTNPLPISLHKCLFTLEGTGITNQVLLKVSEVPVSGTTSATFKYIPPYAGRASLVANFISKELDDVDGYLAYEINPRPEDVIIENGNRIPASYIERTDVVL